MSPMCPIDERIAALGSLRVVNLQNCIFACFSLLCLFITWLDSKSLGLPLPFTSKASKTSIWTMNCSTQANKSVMELGPEKARDFLSSV